MNKVVEIKDELKKELNTYYTENKTDLIGCAFGLGLVAVVIGFICLFVFFTDVMFSLVLLVIGVMAVLLTEIAISDDRNKYSYDKYHLLKEIKYFIMRSIIYPFVFAFIAFLIWIIFK